MESMAAHGVYGHVVLLGNRMLNALLSASAEDATPLCRIYNDGASAACQQHPGQLYAPAMLPYENIPAAISLSTTPICSRNSPICRRRRRTMRARGNRRLKPSRACRRSPLR
jgi:hypothetical protein